MGYSREQGRGINEKTRDCFRKMKQKHVVEVLGVDTACERIGKRGVGFESGDI